MQAQPSQQPIAWSEANSQTFLDYGRHFVPAREQQIETICNLIPAHDHPFTVVELCFWVQIVLDWRGFASIRG
jgi:hypothetical protein